MIVLILTGFRYPHYGFLFKMALEKLGAPLGHVRQKPTQENGRWYDSENRSLTAGQNKY